MVGSTERVCGRLGGDRIGTAGVSHVAPVAEGGRSPDHDVVREVHEGEGQDGAGPPLAQVLLDELSGGDEQNYGHGCCDQHREPRDAGQRPQECTCDQKLVAIHRYLQVGEEKCRQMKI